MEVQPHTFLISALDGGEWSASRPGRLTPGGRNPPPTVPIAQEPRGRNIIFAQ
jgi:hypothetical protein